MRIVKDDSYKRNLQEVLRYIAKDSKRSSSKFNVQLAIKISNLPNMPYKFRQSLYYEDDNIRDLIFKGYTIPYLIDISKDTIVILDIFKYSYRKEA